MTEMKDKRYSDAIERAIRVAVENHQGQYRDDGVTPYVYHVFEVQQGLLSWGVSSIHITTHVCAVCHDLYEDTPFDFAAMEAVFGTKAADIVQELTFDKTKYESKQEYMESFQDKSLESILIKAKDRLVNVRDFKKTKPVYATKYFKKADALWHVALDKAPEIIEFYGEEVFNNLVREIREVALLVGA